MIDYTLSRYGRADCPACGKNISLTKAGTLRSHNVPSYPSAPPYGERCPRSGSTP